MSSDEKQPQGRPVRVPQGWDPVTRRWEESAEAEEPEAAGHWDDRVWEGAGARWRADERAARTRHGGSPWERA
ncbi:hypothetical protein RM844_31745 [Streptomyces sp. DSM 44915]|uniref:Uncharacterized protein n=1 Tax=Streptomyces chisholmiae TaxID=3075540 RepID=A0ABU2K0S7_9ACTN|nr:hypothetical protein [Streptomyces sp. DSM 44915]MDT0270852.1 hypothetical protein [Streptomyces sp. DSM 44915]